MNGVIEDYGIIIKVMPVGDYDKRITMLTKDRGKLSAFARGARRQGSAFMGVTRVFATGKFRLHEGRDSYTLQMASIDNYFDTLTQDIEKTCYGMYFLEVMDYYTVENNDERAMLKLLYQSLRALCSDSYDNKLVRSIFELKSVVLNGEFPGVSEEDVSRLDESTVYTINYIVNSDIEKLYRFSLSEKVLKELVAYSSEIMNHFTDKRFKSLDILENL